MTIAPSIVGVMPFCTMIALVIASARETWLSTVASASLVRTTGSSMSSGRLSSMWLTSASTRRW